MRYSGVSLPELLVSVAIVGVVSAGLYVGFNQIDSAQQAAALNFRNANSQGLLLDLIETETRSAGKNLRASEDSSCLVRPSGSIDFSNDCYDSVQIIPDTAHGVMLCSRIGDVYRTAFFYSSGPVAVSQSNNNLNLQCSDGSQEFFDSYSAVFESAMGCGFNGTEKIDQQDLTDSNLRDSNLCQLNFVRRRGGIGLDIAGAGMKVGETSGNAFNFSIEGAEENSFTAETAEAAQTAEKFTVSLPLTQIYIASGTTYNANLLINDAVDRNLDLPLLIHNGDNEPISGKPTRVTVNQGSQSTSVAGLEIGERLRLLDSPDLLVDGPAELRILNADDVPDGYLPELSFNIGSDVIAYTDAAIDLVAYTSLASGAHKVALSATNLGGSGADLDTIMSASGNTAAIAGTLITFKFPPNATTATISLETLESASTSTSAETYEFSLIDPNNVPDGVDLGGLDQYSISDEVDTLEINAEGNQPVIQWVKSSSELLEPVQTDITVPRESRIYISADRHTSQDLTIAFKRFTNADDDIDAICGSGDSGNYEFVDVVQASGANVSLGGSCFDDGEDGLLYALLPAGEYETSVKLDIRQASGSAPVSENLRLVSYLRGGYRLGDLTEHELTILPKLGAVELDPDGSVYFGSVLTAVSSTTFTVASASVDTNNIFIETGSKGLIVKEEHGADESWTAGSAALSVPEDLGSGTLLFEITTASGSSALTTASGSTTDIMFDTDRDGTKDTDGQFVPVDFDTNNDPPAILKYWVYDDLTEEADERIRLQLHTIIAEKSKDPASSDYVDIVVVDHDQCAIGNQMTIGDSRENHFHTVSLNDMVNENLTAATVRISTGYDSSTDKLIIDGITGVTSGNVTTYSNGSVTYGSQTYSGITAKFLIAQGVMEISRATAMPSSAMVKFLNDSVYFQSTASGQNSRAATFTLGDAQAWNQHEDGTTHYYRYVDQSGVDWDDAMNATLASTNKYFGVQGYLATITSHAENSFLAQKFTKDGAAISGWLGGSNRQTKPSGINVSGYTWPSVLNTSGQYANYYTGYNWAWVTGPEKGRLFWSGLAACGDPIDTDGDLVDIFPYQSGSAAGVSESQVDGNKCQFSYANYAQNQNSSAWPPLNETWRNANDYLTCAAQTQEINNNTNLDQAPRQLLYGYDHSAEISNGRVNPNNNGYRYSNFGCSKTDNKFHQPDWSSNVEYFLQLTGQTNGGQMWNDLKNNPDSQSIWHKKIYEVVGYYNEFGGAPKSEWSFDNRKFSQTNNFTTGACTVTNSSASMGLAYDSCTAWSNLTIGSASAASSGFDFYGPSDDVYGEDISSARVSISKGYVSGTDELIIEDVTANTGTTGQKKYLNFSIVHNGTTYDNIDAIFFINQGVLEITRYTTASGTTKDTMPAEAMVRLFNEKVEFLHDPTGTGLVSSSERQVSYTLGEAQVWENHEDGGDRYYRYVGQHRTWWQARDAAKADSMKYFGVRGYLATVTSLAENKFLSDRFNDNGGPPAGWLGGRDSDSEGHWRWVTGPESSRRFWKNKTWSGTYITGTGNGSGTPVSTVRNCVNQSTAWNGHSHASGYLRRLRYGKSGQGYYTETTNSNGQPVGSIGSDSNVRFANWSCTSGGTPEPNDAGGEDFLQMTGLAKGGGMWNDLRANKGTGDGVYDVKGYYIEYGGPASYAENFDDRRLGRTMKINPQECALVRVD